MRNLRRTARHHTAGTNPVIWYNFAPGQRVLTREGYWGTVKDVEDGPWPDYEQYLVELDDGAGGGFYDTTELSTTCSECGEIYMVFAKYPQADHEHHNDAIDNLIRESADALDDAARAPLKIGSLTKTADEDQCPYDSSDSTMEDGLYTCEEGHVWSPDDPAALAYHGDGPERGKIQPITSAIKLRCSGCGETYFTDGEGHDCGPEGLHDHWTEAASEPEDSVLHVASEDYPVLSEILVDRPPLPHSTRVAALRARQAMLVGDCDHCGKAHPADYHHMGQNGQGPIYAVTCPEDGMTQWHTTEGVREVPDPTPIELSTSREAGILDRVLEPVADHMLDKQQESGFGSYNAETGAMYSYDWCRFRHNRRCFYPKQLDAAATKEAGRAIWVPEDRGFCPREKWDAQKACPAPSEPGPKSGEAAWKYETWQSWEQGGQGRYAHLGMPSFPHSALNTAENVEDLSRKTKAPDPEASEFRSELSEMVEERRRDKNPYAVTSAMREGEFTFHLTATWREVQAKAKEIRSEGHVRIISASVEYLVGEVQGTHNIYQTSLMREPGTKAVAAWECGCAWAAYSWGRSGRWKKYEGRMCSHALALNYEAQSRGWAGGQISEDRKTPDWRRDQKVVVPGDYQRGPIGDWRKASVDEPGYADSIHPVSTDPALAGRPAYAMARDMLADGDSPGEAITLLAALGVEDAPSLVAQAAGTQPFRALVDGMVTEILDLLGDGTAKTQMGTVPVSQVLYPTYTPSRGLTASLRGAEGSMDDPRVAEAVQEFLDRENLPGRTPWDAADQCYEESTRFKRLLESKGVEAKVVMGYHRDVFQGQQVITQGHVGVQVGDSVYDWTARQFDEHAPVPRIVSVSEWWQEWPSLHAQASADSDGYMAAIEVPESLKQALHSLCVARYGDDVEPMDNYHVTVVYPGAKEDVDAQAFAAAVVEWATRWGPMTGSISGFGVFHQPGGDKVLYASVNVPGLDRARDDLVSLLAARGIAIPDTYGYSPHLTLGYFGEANTPEPPQEADDIVNVEFPIDTVTLALGSNWHPVPLIKAPDPTQIAAAAGIGQSVASVVDDALDMISFANDLGLVDEDAVRWYSSSDAGQAAAQADGVGWGGGLHTEEYGPVTGRHTVGEVGSTAGTSNETDGSVGSSHEAELKDDPEPALPSTTSEDDDPFEAAEDLEDRPFVPGDSRLAHLMTGAAPVASQGGEDMRIAEAARAHLAKDPAMQREALKAFTPAEQKQIIEEGAEAGVTAANLGDLDISGTHYEALEAAFAAAEAEVSDDEWLM